MYISLLFILKYVSVPFTSKFYILTGEQNPLKRHWTAQVKPVVSFHPDNPQYHHLRCAIDKTSDALSTNTPPVSELKHPAHNIEILV